MDNGKVVTAAGISSGIDGELYLVSRLHGADVARATATYIEYDHWSGFDVEGRPQPVADERGVVSQPGRVHETRSWKLLELIQQVRAGSIEQAVADYPTMLDSATGVDRQMMSLEGLRMSADWLLKHGRDKEIALAILKFAAAAFPNSTRAHADLGRALLGSGEKAEASVVLEKALALEPQNKSLLELLEQCK